MATRPESPGYLYKADFFDFVDVSSGRSALAFVRALALGFEPASVLDVGCGRGVWLRAWKDLGVKTVAGVDGDYVDRSRLQIDPQEFFSADLTSPIDLGRAFDLVECLEVAEHLAPNAADTLVASLARHGDVILFSAARPGQGGEHHINEQPVGYWVERFRALGFSPYDFPRRAVQGLSDIEPWYRYNAMLFANEPGARRLSSSVLNTALPRGAAVPDLAPLAWRLRCAVLAALPTRWVTGIARMKHRLVK